MKVLSCNIRTSLANDGDNHWNNRKGLFAKIVAAHAPDIFCVQEMTAQQMAEVSAAFPDFASCGTIDEPLGDRPINSIFYKKDAWQLLAANGYWLSDKPHVPGSRFRDSACVRIANHARLKERATGLEFRLINTHLDHIGQIARENQAKIINEDAAAFPAEYPQILTGDMNCDSSNKAIAIFKAAGWRDSYAAIHGTEDPGFTYHAFQGPRFESTIGKMDWVFWRGALKPTNAEVIADSDGQRFPSDHYFVSATFVASNP